MFCFEKSTILKKLGSPARFWTADDPSFTGLLGLEIDTTESPNGPSAAAQFFAYSPFLVRFK
jgi:hypothetical protein